MSKPFDPLLEVLIRRDPPLRLVTGPDATEALVLEQNIKHSQITVLGKGKRFDHERAARILAAFLHEFTWALDRQSLLRLVDMSIQETMSPGFLAENLVVNIGFGGTEEGVPLRAVSYALPGLEFLDRLNKLGIAVPHLRLFSGQMLAHFCLGKDLNLMWKNSVTLFVLIKLFAQRFYSGVAKSFVFDFDRSVTFGSINQDLHALAKVLRQRDDPQTVEALEILENMAHNQGGNVESAILYGAGHPGTFGDFTHRGTAATGWLSENDPHFMVAWGSPAEMKFWAVRRVLTHLASQVLDNVHPIPFSMLITEIGREKPPYYRHPKGDLNWLEAGKWHERWAHLPVSVQKELTLLANKAGDIGGLLVWIDEIHQIFDAVSATGPYAEELLGHSILGCPVVRQTVSAQHFIDAAIQFADLPSKEETPLVLATRNWWMRIR